MAGRCASHINAPEHDWRFLSYNHKFDEYCELSAANNKRTVNDGDKFQLIYTQKERNMNYNWAESMVSQLSQLSNRPSSSHSSNEVVAMAEIQNQTPLVLLNDDDNDEDVKPVRRLSYGFMGLILWGTDIV